MSSFDPWNESVNVISTSSSDHFEDNFEPIEVDSGLIQSSCLPDSEEYLNKLGNWILNFCSVLDYCSW